MQWIQPGPVNPSQSTVRSVPWTPGEAAITEAKLTKPTLSRVRLVAAIVHIPWIEIVGAPRQTRQTPLALTQLLTST